MNLGFLMPLSLETITTARQLGYDSIEVGAGWLSDTLGNLEQNQAVLKAALQEQNIKISSVAIYGGTVNAPVSEAVNYWTRAIKLTRALGCNVVSGLTGRDNALTVDQNLPLFKERLEPIAQVAADNGVHIAFEPWPGSVLGHGPYHWTNMATTPELWDKLLDTVQNPALGLEYDPSHLYWQEIDYVRAIREYGSRIYHLHAKDIVVDKNKLGHVGVHGNGWWRFVLPGLGVLDWSAIFTALKDVNYKGDIAVEHEDNAYMNEKWNEGLAIALRNLRPYVTAFNK
ncbi:MAG: sugar phosphate isomerase/epimerase [Chloroflexi bacterium]|nr:sugar phosphate isomerase/epimerase [Chloroflexota bacterium]